MTTTEFPFVAWYTEGVDEYTAISVTIHPPYQWSCSNGYADMAVYDMVVDYVDHVTGEDRQIIHFYEDPSFAPRSAQEILSNFEAEYLRHYFPPKS